MTQVKTDTADDGSITLTIDGDVRGRYKSVQDMAVHLAMAIDELQQRDADTVRMPRTLTAENGAKALLIGEFYEERENEYHCRCGMGPDSCEICELTDDNMIPETLRMQVSWTTIKEIYKKAVEHFGESDAN